MTANNGTLYDYQCSQGLVLPFINEFTWPVEARAFLYFIGLLYCFLGVAIIADIFMGAIEKITSTTRKIYLSRGQGEEPQVVEVRLWNDTVANLTLMALGSSAPEILLSIIEIIKNNFESGQLGPGTIVGSAAFNLMAITAVCIMGVPKGEIRRINGIKVFGITAVFSILAYLWLLVVLVGISQNEVELWEAIVTFLLFPVLVILAYLTDRGGIFCCRKPQIVAENGKQIELGAIQPGELDNMLNEADRELSLVKDGELDRDVLAKFVRRAIRQGLSGEDAAKLAAFKLVNSKEHSRIWYRIGAVRDISGGKRLTPQLNTKLKEKARTSLEKELFQVYEAINEHPETPNLGSVPEGELQDKAVIEFHAFSCAVPENIGKFAITVVRHGKLDNNVAVRVETIDGSAREGQDYIAVNEVLNFSPGETEKQVTIEIIDDNQYEPDEQFYLKLTTVHTSVVNKPGRLALPALNSVSAETSTLSDDVQLGRASIMEITILNDDDPGILTFEERGFLVKESVGMARIPVVRKQGADGEVSVRWRTVDKTATNGKDFRGGEGTLVFKHAETKLVIEIPIINDDVPEKDECFEVELFDTTNGAKLGPITNVAVTITNDEEFNSVLRRLAQLTNANVESLEVHHETWVSQFRDAMNVNGGDIENATTMDYVMHFFTFGWKILFAFVPPAGLLGGWLCFFVSLGVIGILTAIVGDLASIFGCLIGLEDAVTAITFVAMGTSLPDLFASKTAAAQEKYADNAIGNVTGSNSVNVFLGLGLPWLIAAIYHTSKGQKFEVQAGSLSFSILIFTITALLTIGLLIARRKLSIFGRGELGGPAGTRYASGIFLLSLWFIYIILSSLESYHHIQGF